jgi:hypothetical protein
MPPAIEPVPATFQRIAAFGVVLAVPAEWNPVALHARPAGLLARLRTDDPAARGVIVLADLHGPRLEVRWRTCAGEEMSGRALRRTLRKLARAGNTPREAHGFHQLAAPGRTAFLTAIGDRLYELHLPGEAPVDAPDILLWFLRTNRHLTQTPAERFWSLYGAQGWTPREAVVRKFLLQPGRVEVALAWRGGRKSLGAFGLADHLIDKAGGNFLQWAKTQPWTRGVAGQWEEEAGVVRFQGLEYRQFCRRLRHELIARLDGEANRIAWEHLRGRNPL